MAEGQFNKVTETGKFFSSGSCVLLDCNKYARCCPECNTKHVGSHRYTKIIHLCGHNYHDQSIYRMMSFSLLNDIC